VYFGHDILSGNNIVIKLERVKGKIHTLGHEYHIYTKLKGGTSIPHAHWFGMEAGFNVMVVDCLSRSLEDLFVHCHFKFMIKAVLLLARQLVSKINF